MAKKKKKKTTKPISQSELDLLKPVNIMELGSDLDCFGKEYDLSTDECKRCGDSEFCAIASAANLHGERAKVEKKVEFKDISDQDISVKIHEFIEKKLDRDIPHKKIISRLVKRFGMDKKAARKLMKEYTK